MNYKLKYFKYKNKYLNLKKQNGGNLGNNILTIEQKLDSTLLVNILILSLFTDIVIELDFLSILDNDQERGIYMNIINNINIFYTHLTETNNANINFSKRISLETIVDPLSRKKLLFEPIDYRYLYLTSDSYELLVNHPYFNDRNIKLKKNIQQFVEIFITKYGSSIPPIKILLRDYLYDYINDRTINQNEINECNINLPQNINEGQSNLFGAIIYMNFSDIKVKFPKSYWDILLSDINNIDPTYKYFPLILNNFYKYLNHINEATIDFNDRRTLETIFLPNINKYFNFDDKPIYLHPDANSQINLFSHPYFIDRNYILDAIIDMYATLLFEKITMTTNEKFICKSLKNYNN
jgi:hypothetical protein